MASISLIQEEIGSSWRCRTNTLSSESPLAFSESTPHVLHLFTFCSCCAYNERFSTPVTKEQAGKWLFDVAEIGSGTPPRPPPCRPWLASYGSRRSCRNEVREPWELRARIVHYSWSRCAPVRLPQTSVDWCYSLIREPVPWTAEYRGRIEIDFPAPLFCRLFTFRRRTRERVKRRRLGFRLKPEVEHPDQCTSPAETERVPGWVGVDLKPVGRVPVLGLFQETCAERHGLLMSRD